MTNFKKFGVAAAVAAALGASSAAQALILGQPGEALLIPYVQYDSANQVNTLIGVTVANRAVTGSTPAEFAVPTTATENLGAGCVGTVVSVGTAAVVTPASLHYYFFNQASAHLADGAIAVTCEDFVRIDWGYLVSKFHKTMDGTNGYMVIANNSARGGTVADATTGLNLYGASYRIQGNWASEAFIPVLPLLDGTDTAGDEVLYSGGVPFSPPAVGRKGGVNPLTAGMVLPTDLSTETVRFSMRYFLDPALGGITKFVLWFPENAAGASILYDASTGKITKQDCATGPRCGVPVEVYDADEGHVSSVTSLPLQLNVIDANTFGGVTNGPAPNGLPFHVDSLTDGAAPPQAVDSGFVLFALTDGAATSDANALVSASRAGVAFSLINITGGSNGSQVQTELAHQRGIYTPE